MSEQPEWVRATDYDKLRDERDRLADQVARERELLQQVTAQRDEALALVREATEAMVSRWGYINDVHVITWHGPFNDWLARARALRNEDGDWLESLDRAMPGTGTLLREDGAK